MNSLGRLIRSAALGLLLFSWPLAAQAQSSFTNSATLRASVAGTNLVVNFSLTSTRGWVTLLAAVRPEALAANARFVNLAAVPPSRQGQFLVPLDRAAPAQYYRLLLEQWPSRLFNYPDLR